MSVPPSATDQGNIHWSREETMVLIELYRQHPYLWNVKVDMYRDRDKRAAALRQITEDMNRSGTTVTTSEIFNDPLLLGLDDNPPATVTGSATPTVPRMATPTLSRSAAELNTREPSPTPSTSKQPTKRVSDDADNVLKEAIHHLQSLSSSENIINDADSDFGQVVANDLRQMSGENKIHAQKLIYEILYLGKLGRLSSSTTIM
ncbi:putative Alcohol dehydrogenase transcription factor Myb/SANT-like-containing protein 7 [Homarus americanus]|uniref:Putative Alcohol dehydrogenase transcription factor Myb/SANT-like-containing protein 7 n=1 Tax=Homarus americanus TaxID=6706 RepID=A0A8J5K0W8_HOMAM|nr:putative Alcohol dehydrogenase transcription factor Myb/SANT-like-containing protein 7 [Homarus americanus]